MGNRIWLKAFKWTFYHKVTLDLASTNMFVSYVSEETREGEGNSNCFATCCNHRQHPDVELRSDIGSEANIRYADIMDHCHPLSFTPQPVYNIVTPTEGYPGHSSIVDHDVKWQVLLTECHCELFGGLEWGQVQCHKLHLHLLAWTLSRHLLLQTLYGLYTCGNHCNNHSTLAKVLNSFLTFQ